MIANPNFWDADFENQYKALISVETLTAASYDEIEGALVELLAHSDGQGASYRETEPDPDNPGRGWVPIRNLATLDTYHAVDHTTWLMVRWEMMKLVYRPTSAASGTAAGTRPGVSTSTQASGPSGQASRPSNGGPNPSAISGMSGG